MELTKNKKMWDHLPIRPRTFLRFRELRGDKYKSDDAFVKVLLTQWEKKLIFLEKKMEKQNV